MQIDIQGNADRVYEAIIEIDRRIVEVFGYPARKIAPVPGTMSLKEGFLEVHYKIFGLKKPAKEESYYDDLVLSYTEIMTDYIVEFVKNPILREENKIEWENRKALRDKCIEDSKYLPKLEEV